MLCKDIELACDEKVIKNMSFDDKKEYSRALVSCATQRRKVLAYPLTFGEEGVKERVKSILSYKRPAFLITMIAIVVCIIVAICFLTNPTTEDIHVHESVRNVEVRIASEESGNVAEFDGTDTNQEKVLLAPEQTEENAVLQDLAYYLELSVSDMEFRDMSETKKAEVLEEYVTLLDEYTLIARESTDGKTSYIVGHYNGDGLNSPLYKMQDMGYTSDKHYQIFYSEENYEAMDRVKDEHGVQAITDEGYVIENSWMYRTADSEYVFIQPADSRQELNSTFAKYLDPARGRRYINRGYTEGYRRVWIWCNLENKWRSALFFRKQSATVSFGFGSREMRVSICQS